MAGFKTALAIGGKRGRPVQTADVETAAFFGLLENGEVVVEPTRLRNSNIVRPLRGRVCGLKSSPRRWRQFLINVFPDSGLVTIKVGNSIFAARIGCAWRFFGATHREGSTQD